MLRCGRWNGLAGAAAMLVLGCGDDGVSAMDTTTSAGSSTSGVTTSVGDGMEVTSAPPVDDTTSATTGPSTATMGEESTTTGPIPCTSDDECVDAAKSECEHGVCDDDGFCDSRPLDAGTSCGDATADECTAPDTCDGAGNCEPNHAPDASGCSTCQGEICQCSVGVCGECAFYAPFNTFVTDRAIEGWTFTGSWGLWRAAPQSELSFPSEFVGQVLGTDGNRVAPYAEAEASYARTSPTILPAEIGFASWHVDEGGASGSDNKTVRVSVDGGMSWTTLADCTVDSSWAFCQPNDVPNPNAWFPINIPVPQNLQGQVGIVEFGYDTGDACCNFEQGWYIDFLNVATECACTSDDVCATYSTTCGTGVCMPSGECGFDPLPADDPCGDPAANECNLADGCDGVGYCRDNLQASGLSFCADCPGGQVCSFCDDGACLDCLSFSSGTTFDDPGDIQNWTITTLQGTAGWGLYDAAPPNNSGQPNPTPFPNGPVLGTDGNRSLPYPGGETEWSTLTTSPAVVPASIDFISWNVDEGSSPFDTKIIELSVDGGASWNTLVNCDLGNTQPFCNSVSDSRSVNDWDTISLDTSAWQGMSGMLRFTYDTGDSCCSFERGWYIDDLNFGSYCDDVPFQ